jgi:hypothetical protein
MHAYLIDCVIFLLFFSGIRWHLPGRNYASGRHVWALLQSS